MDLEAFGLLLHVLQEYAEVGGDAVGTFKVLDVVASVQLLAQVFTHGLNVDDRLWESDVWLTRVLESDRSKNLKLLVLTLGICLLLFLINFDRFLVLTVRDAIELFQFFFETTEMHGIVSDGADGLDEGDSHADTDCSLTLGLAVTSSCLVQSKIIIRCLFTEVLKLVDKLINTLLGLLALGHLRSHALLGKAARLTIGLAKTLLG